MRILFPRRVPVTVAAVATILALFGCADGDAKTSEGASTAVTQSPGGTVQAGDAVAYCREAKAHAMKNANAIGSLVIASTPAEVKAAFDTILTTNTALAAVAPAELRDSYRVVGETWRAKREAAERAGWSPKEANRLFSDLPNESEEHLLAAGEISSYWFTHCE